MNQTSLGSHWGLENDICLGFHLFFITGLKVENDTLNNKLQLSTTATSFALYARETLARLCAHDAGWNSSVERARIGRSHGRKGRKERSERQSIHEILENIRWILPQEDRKQEKGGRGRHDKKNWAPKKYCLWNNFSKRTKSNANTVPTADVDTEKTRTR